MVSSAQLETACRVQGHKLALLQGTQAEQSRKRVLVILWSFVERP